MLVLLAAVALLVVGVIVVLAASPRIALPYGVKPGMNIGEIRRQMEDNGFDYEWEQQYSDHRVLFFGSSYVRGYQADAVVVTVENNGGIAVGVFYGESREYGRRNPSACFAALREELMDEYGKPDTDFSGYTDWEQGHYRLSLSYTDQTGGDLCIRYTYTR